MICYGWVLWHINHCRLFNAKSSLCLYIRYMGFGLVGFNGISTLVGYLITNLLHTYISNIWDLVSLGWWHINHCRLFNVRFSLYIYIKYMGFGLVGFYGIVGYIKPNTLYKYAIIYMFWVSWVYGISTLVSYWMPNHLYALYIYIYIWFTLTGFYGISTIVDYLMPNLSCTLY